MIYPDIMDMCTHTPKNSEPHWMLAECCQTSLGPLQEAFARQTAKTKIDRRIEHVGYWWLLCVYDDFGNSLEFRWCLNYSNTASHQTPKLPRLLQLQLDKGISRYEWKCQTREPFICRFWYSTAVSHLPHLSIFIEWYSAAKIHENPHSLWVPCHFLLQPSDFSHASTPTAPQHPPTLPPSAWRKAKQATSRELAIDTWSFKSSFKQKIRSFVQLRRYLQRNKAA